MTRRPTIDHILHPAHAAAQELAQLSVRAAVIDSMLDRLSRLPPDSPPPPLTYLEREIARTDAVMLHSLRAGFLRVGTDECLRSAEVIAAEIARRTDASCEGWARNLGLPIDGRRSDISVEQQRDAQFNRQVAAIRGAL